MDDTGMQVVQVTIRLEQNVIAHQNNDRAVMAAYGFPVKTMTESQCVAERYNPFFRNSRRQKE